VAEAVTLLVYWLAVPLRRVGLVNLAIAFPDRPLAERKRILRASVLNLSHMAADLAATCRT
jgi:lauroyl/myristoyl acyltransferase